MEAEGGMRGRRGTRYRRRHPPPAPDSAAEIFRLRRENDRLRTERDILKKAVAITAGEPAQNR